MTENDPSNKSIIEATAKKSLTEVSNQANKLIKDYAFSSSVTGFIPVPFVDTLGLIWVQRLMLFRMSQLYGIPFKKNSVKIALTTLTSGLSTRLASPVVGSMFKMIPGIGTILGGASMATLGSASTYAVGKVFQQHFEKGGTLEDFDAQKVKKSFDEELEKGKEIAESQQQKAEPKE